MADIRILLIDDDRTARESLAFHLRDMIGFEVVEFDNGSDALRHLEAGRMEYTTVLLDYVLGLSMTGEQVLAVPMSGEQVLTEIRQHYPQLPVIVFTGLDPKGGVEALSKGAHRSLQKPLDRAELVNIIRGLAEQEAIFRRMAQDVRQMLGSNMCLAWRLDRQARRFQIVAWDGDKGLEAEYRRTTFLDLEDPHTKSVFENKSPIFFTDVKDPKSAPYYKPRDYAVRQGWTSLISIPLLRLDRIIGLVDSYTYEELTNKETLGRWLRDILPPFARQAAEAIWSTELSNRLQALQGLNEVLAGAFEEETILQQILAKGLELVVAEAGWVFRLDVNKGKLILKRSIGVPESKIGPERELGEGITGWVVQTGQALNVPDVTKPSQEYKHLGIPGLAVKSEVAVPLRRGEQIIGAMTATSPFPSTFTAEDVSLLSSLAAQAAVAIGHADVTRHSQELGRLALTGDFGRLAEYAVEAARDLTGADVILWMMGDEAETEIAEEEREKGPWLRVRTSKGNIDLDYRKKAKTPIAPGSSLTALALQRGEPIVRRDIQGGPEEPGEPGFYNRESAKQHGWHGFMAVPLFKRGSVPLGSLSLYGTEVAKFGEAEVSLMQAFAGQIVTAFENARLLQDLRRLVEISEVVTHEIAKGLKPVLDRVAESACKLTGADYAVIYPYDPDRELFYDLKNVAMYGLPESRSPKEKPRKRGLAAIVRDINELVVYDVEQGKLGSVDYSRIQQPDLPPMNEDRLLEFIREEKFIQEEGVKAFVGLSLKAGLSAEGKEQEVGVLYLDFRHPHHFTAEDLDLVRVFGHQVGSAIQATRLLQRERQKLALLEALQTTLSDILAQHEPARVAETIATSASQLMGGKKGLKFQGAIWSCDHQAHTVMVEHSYNDNLLGITLRFGQGLAGRVAQNGKPLYMNNYHEWEGRATVFDKEPLYDLFASVIEVPLLWENQVIGVLAVSSPQPVEFDEEDVRTLEQFAGLAAIGFQNARLYKALITGATSLLEMPQKVDVVLERIVQSALDWLGADLVILYEYHKGRDKEFPRDPVLGGRFLEPSLISVEIPEDSVILRATALHRPNYAVDAVRDHFIVGKLGLRVPATDNLPERDRFVIREGIKSSAIVPLIARGEVVGVMFVNYRKPKLFTEIVKGEIELFGAQAALAIRTARTFEQLRVLQRIQRVMAEVRRLDEVLELILRQALDLIGSSRGWISLYNPQNDCLEIKAFRPSGPDEVTARAHIIKSGQGITGQVFKKRRPLKVRDVRRRKNYEKFFEDTRSELCVPLRFRDETIGVLNIESRRFDAFSDEDLDLLSILADQAATTIEGSRLYERLGDLATRKVRDLQVVSRVGQQLTEGIRKEEPDILELIYQEASKVMNTDNLYIALYDKTTNIVRFGLAYLAGRRVDVDNEKGWQSRKAGRGRTEWIIRTGQPLFIATLADSKAWYDEPGHKEYIGQPFASWIGVPMIAGQEVLGVIATYHTTKEYVYNQDDLEVLSVMASQAAIALDSAQLIRQLGERIKELHKIRELSEELSAGVWLGGA